VLMPPTRNDARQGMTHRKEMRAIKNVLQKD
jgi:hypothetical protein